MRNPGFNRNRFPYLTFAKITQNDFAKTLHVLEQMPNLFSDEAKQGLFKDIDIILSKSREVDGVDIGIGFANGKFYKAGDEELDTALIDKPISSIEGYDAKKDYIKALEKYACGDLHGTLSMCFTTLESFSQEVLENKKGLKQNKEEILKFFGGSKGFSKQWAGNLNNLYDYLNDYSERHNGEKRSETNPLEVEATLYITGLIINLLTSKLVELGEQ